LVDQKRRKWWDISIIHKYFVLFQDMQIHIERYSVTIKRVPCNIYNFVNLCATVFINPLNCKYLSNCAKSKFMPIRFYCSNWKINVSNLVAEAFYLIPSFKCHFNSYVTICPRVQRLLQCGNRKALWILLRRFPELNHVFIQNSNSISPGGNDLLLHYYFNDDSKLGQLYYHNWATKSFVKGQCMTTTLFAENGNMNLEHNIA
jgi:hypothetical protein